MKMDLIANFIDKNNLELDNKVDATELVDNLTIDLDLISLDELDVIDGDFSSVYPEYHEKWEKLYWMIKSTLLVKIVEENKDSEEKNEEEEEEEEEEGDEDEDGIENLNNFKRSLRLIEQELTIFPFLRETSKKTISRHPRLKKVVTKAKNAKKQTHGLWGYIKAFIQKILDVVGFIITIWIKLTRKSLLIKWVSLFFGTILIGGLTLMFIIVWPIMRLIDNPIRKILHWIAKEFDFDIDID